MLTKIQYTQNFLQSEALVSQLVEQAKISAGETVLEIGPGKGIITQALADAVGAHGTVVAVELDQTLARQLSQKFTHTPQVKILQQDFLHFDLAGLGVYKVFANLPFAISASILEKLLQPTNGPESAFLILQTESLASLRGNKEQPTFKSLLFAPFYELRILHHFQRRDFTPAPQVETALFAMKRRDKSLIPEQSNELWKDFLAAISQDRVGEGSWRKLFLSRELQEAIKNSKLQKGKGLRAQTAEALVQLFRHSIEGNPARAQKLNGSFATLRKRQAAVVQKNELEGHKPQRT